MKRVLVFLLLASLAAAMVPHSRVLRAVYTEDEAKPKTAPTEENKIVICQQQTPCEWRFFKPKTEILIETIVNKYCVCSPSQTCQYSDVDSAANAHTYRCRPPPTGDSTNDDSDSTYS